MPPRLAYLLAAEIAERLRGLLTHAGEPHSLIELGDDKVFTLEAARLICGEIVAGHYDRPTPEEPT